MPTFRKKPRDSHGRYSAIARSDVARMWSPAAVVVRDVEQLDAGLHPGLHVKGDVGEDAAGVQVGAVDLAALLTIPAQRRRGAADREPHSGRVGTAGRLGRRERRAASARRPRAGTRHAATIVAARKHAEVHRSSGASRSGTRGAAGNGTSPWSRLRRGRRSGGRSTRPRCRGRAGPRSGIEEIQPQLLEKVVRPHAVERVEMMDFVEERCAEVRGRSKWWRGRRRSIRVRSHRSGGLRTRPGRPTLGRRGRLRHGLGQWHGIHGAKRRQPSPAGESRPRCAATAWP